MIIVLRPDAKKEDIDHILDRADKLGLKPHISKGTERTIIGLIGPEDALRAIPLEAFHGVENVIPILAPYKLVSREFKKENSVVPIGEHLKIGGKKIIVLAGPCAIENEDLLLEIGEEVKFAGASVLRGGAYKPRTSPYAFQGMGLEGLKILSRVSKKLNMPTVTEVMDVRDVGTVAQYADILQIGARNMQNFTLLKEVGLTRKPVLLKRGLANTVKELLMSAEYIMAEGNHNVILCERGIRTFEDATRNTFDVSAIPVVKQLSHLPIIADPSHAAGKWNLVAPLACAAVAAGADGLIIEAHTKPEEALSDGAQSLLPEKLTTLMQSLEKIALAIHREM
ncbi:MAG: 3-deoxy-7-phosphoheptulonate synthase [Candidatus Omnitrophota bacterium]|jgi:3-deoxy-7-phosphoheptulonate synthase|nr:3-deoxy-7-phosphoheptulonate synthase [Candidatus Omnitrophota bacterium]MDD5137557.1 3-deoxy-7-phosphoheptulonate synthase [Candidatus Omnitrophota bacterium]MDD5538095.1 3-deoxy-7-phosphoheptulonate synthase [Candidatus Omnitrophota bacterium]